MPTAPDFDALVAHRQGTTLTVVGQSWPVPVELPHQAMLYLDALQADKGADYELGWLELVTLATHTFGEAVVAQWLAGGVGVQRLQPLMEWTIDFLRPRPQPALPEGDGQGP